MKVAFIGLGIMGMPMATNISKKYDLIGCDVVEKETPFPFTKSYKECVEGRDVIISMVPKSEHALALYAELRKYLKPGQICIDMSTIAVAASREIAASLEAMGVEMLDCPVVKSQPAAVKGELGIYVGGKEEVFEKVRGILECMGKNIIRIGDHGTGALMKILHNSLVGEIQNGVNEVLGLAESCGLDLEKVVTAFSYGGAQNFYMDGKAKNIESRTYPTAFSVANMNKDVHFAIEIAEAQGKEMPALHNVVKVYEAAMEKGLERQDFSATYEIVNPK
ncbi:MAG: NAD(P)-dependent oxidoreductase [Bacilli bacterium]|nr:NAD(P)-dependent oxidoreductase [Bacilli bacterium]